MCLPQPNFNVLDGPNCHCLMLKVQCINSLQTLPKTNKNRKFGGLPQQHFHGKAATTPQNERSKVVHSLCMSIL